MVKGKKGKGKIQGGKLNEKKQQNSKMLQIGKTLSLVTSL